MASVNIPFAPPPRVTGYAEIDFASMVEWLWSFYQSAIVQGGLVQNIGFSGAFREELQERYPTIYNLGTLAGTQADRLGYFTGPNAWALTVLTAFARSLLDDETQAEARSTLGLGAIATEGYSTGTWVPAFTNLTEVPGSGTITKTGRYTVIGRIVNFQVSISTTGGATTAATAGNTYHDLPVNASHDDVCLVANRTTNIGLGTGAIDATNDRVYVPTWAATSHTIVISGRYET
jgi:hypothetical protein